MVVAFNEIPQAIRVPLFYAEVNAGGSVYNSASRLLLIGQKLAAGAAMLDAPVLVASGAEDSLFGSNSMLAAMVRVARFNAPFQEIWALPVTDGGGAASATGIIDMTALTLPVTSSTTLIIYIGGKRYRIAITTASTATTVGDALVTAITDDLCQVVTAANVAGVVTLTARHPGLASNDIDIRMNYYGTEPVLATNPTITAMAGGTADPDISLGLAALGSDEFDWIALPYSDTVNLDQASDFLDNSVGRWNPMQQLYGHFISIAEGTVGGLSAKGLLRNDPHTSLIGAYRYPTNNWEILAGASAKAAKHLSAAPELSRPLQFIEIANIMAPAIADRFSIVDKNVLLYDGIATLGIARDNSVSIQRLATTYQLNDVGFVDATWLDIQTAAQTMYTIRYLRSKITNAHGRQALMDDENSPIQGVSRPKDVKATIIAGYVELNQLAVVENVSLFEQQLIVERNATDNNRIDVYLPIDVVNQLRIIAMNATTFLQFTE